LPRHGLSRENHASCIRKFNSTAVWRSPQGDWDGEITMKKFLLGTVGLLALGIGAPASAADLAARPYTKAPPPVVAPIYDWTGFYIGGNGGWGQRRHCLEFVDAFGVFIADGCRERSGGLVGGQIGYRWQASQ